MSSPVSAASADARYTADAVADPQGSETVHAQEEQDVQRAQDEQDRQDEQGELDDQATAEGLPEEELDVGPPGSQHQAEAFDEEVDDEDSGIPILTDKECAYWQSFPSLFC